MERGCKYFISHAREGYMIFVTHFHRIVLACLRIFCYSRLYSFCIVWFQVLKLQKCLDKAMRKKKEERREAVYFDIDVLDRTICKFLSLVHVQQCTQLQHCFKWPCALYSFEIYVIGSFMEENKNSFPLPLQLT